MTKRILISVFLLLALANIGLLFTGNADQAELVISGVTFTDGRENMAIAIANKKFIYVGDAKYVYPLIGKDTKVKNLEKAKPVAPVLKDAEANIIIEDITGETIIQNGLIQ